MENNFQATALLTDMTSETAGLYLVHELISDRAAATPDKLAVTGPEGSVTFQDLEQRSNQLARHLQSLGAGIGTPVGLYLERSCDFVTAALAVLKTGGVYVPLDPAYPPGRIDAILKDAQVPVLVSHKWMAAGLAGGAWSTIDLDIDGPKIGRCSTDSLNMPVTCEDLAYLIYTSGSTGQPKGVEVTHANLSHLVSWHTRAFSVTPEDRASQVAGLAFDAAVWEIWCHLAAGASLHLIDEGSRRSPEGLRDWLVEQKITIAFVPTVMAEYLITFDWPKDTALCTLLTGADTLHRYPKAGLPFTLVNNYGPTECTVLVTSGAVNAGTGNGQIPSIGQAIDDTTIYILDASLRPVSDGESGEICVTGPQVAKGYRNLPELTAEKFVNSPTYGRMYRTGDQGRRLPSGEIAFLGRLDDQIKIRGFRVEPDEIVAQLNAHSDVRNSAVIARGEASEEKALVAYLVLTQDSKLTSSALRDYLKARVPDYMVPAAFVKLDALPTTTTGKCDKQALPAPSPHNMLADEQANDAGLKESSHSATEEKIAQLVSGVMNSRAVTRDDNFFLIGGHSMLAAQLLARVRESLGVSLNLRQLFEAPTIASLSAVVDRQLADK